MLIKGNQYGNMGYQVSYGRDTKLDIFSTKNQHMDIIVFCVYICVIILENNVF